MRILREVPIFSSIGVWKEFHIATDDQQQNENQSNEKNRLGKGFAIKPLFASGSSKLTRNRFLLWKIAGNMFEMMELSLDYSLVENAIRLIFIGSSIVPSVGISERIEGIDPTINVYLITRNNTFLRLLFPHPINFTGGGGRKEKLSILSTLTEESLVANKIYGVCRGQTPTILVSINEETSIIGTGAGTLHIVNIKPQGPQLSHEEVELSERKMVQWITSFVPGFVRTQDSKSVVGLSIHLWNRVVYAICLTSDNKLRIWNVEGQKLLLTMDIEYHRWNTRSNNMTVNDISMRFVAEPNSSNFEVVIYISLSGESQFQRYAGSFLEPENPKVSLELACTDYSSKDHLIDFEASHSGIWTLWENPRKPCILQYSRYSVTGPLEVNNWEDVYLHDAITEPPYPRNQNTQEFFVSTIFEVGRFSKTTLEKAMKVYKADANTSNITLQQLQTQIISLIQEEIELKILRNLSGKEEDSAQIRGESIYQAWKEFWRHCVKFHQEEFQPMGLFYHQYNNMLIIVRKDSFSFLRTCEELESIQLFLSHMKQSQLPESRLTGAIMGLEKIGFNVVHLLSLAQFSGNSLGSLLLYELDYDLSNLGDPLELFYPLIQTLITGVSDDENISEEDAAVLRLFVHTFLKNFKNIENPLETVKTILKLFHPTSSKVTQNENPAAVDFCTELFGSSLSEFTFAIGFKQLIETRYILARNLLLTLFFLSRLSVQILTPDEIDVLTSELIPKTIKLLKTYIQTKWLSNQYETENRMPASLEQSITHFSTMNLSNEISPSKKLPKTLVQLYYQANLITLQTGVLGKSVYAISAVTDHHINTWGMFNLIFFTFIDLFESREGRVNFANFLEQHGQTKQLVHYVKLLEENSSSLMYILGLAHSSMGEYKKAKEYFFKAAARVNGDDLDRFIQLWKRDFEMDSMNDYSILSEYFLAVVRIFETYFQHQEVVEFAFSALSRLDHDRKNEPVLWTHIFKSSLECADFDTAYRAIMSHPEEQMRLLYLKRFIEVLCEKRLIKMLVQLPFIGMVDNVRQILEESAHRSDITKEPNFYYILYAFHTHRGNHRQAAIAMYEISQRISIECHSKDINVLQQQASYCAIALNSLKLVEPKYQWINSALKTVNKAPDLRFPPTSPKRKRDNEIFESILFPDITERRTTVQTAFKKEELPIIYINHLEQQYMLIKANINLLERSQKLPISGSLIPAEDAVALLSENSQFDQAFTLARVFKLGLDVIFEQLTKKCLQQSQMYSEEMDFEEVEGGSYWDLLRQNLEKYDNQDTNYSYHFLVADRILTTDYRNQIPNWLTLSLKEKHPSLLLQVYLKHQLLMEAALVALYLINKTKYELHVKESVILPYTWIDQLLSSIEVIIEDRRYEGQYKKHLIDVKQQIDTNLQEYFEELK